MARDHIQRTLDIIYDKIFNQGRADLLPALVSGPYIQHNPLFPNGLDGIMGYIKQAGRIPCEVKRIAVEGDLAFVHVRYLDWGSLRPFVPVSQVVAFSQGIDADPSCQGVRQIIRDCNVSSLAKLLGGRKVSASETIRVRIRRLLQRCSSTMSAH